MLRLLAEALPGAVRAMTRKQLLRLIERDEQLRALRDWAKDKLADDPGHDLAHALRVAMWTMRLAPGASQRECTAAALLHDIVNLPKDSPERARASELSATEARRVLPGFGFEPQAVRRIADAVRDHSYSRGAVPKTELGRGLHDADRLEALGVLGVFRTISTGTRMGADYFDADDPWAESRALNDLRFCVDHFFTKLLRLPDTLQTAAGRQEARRRAARMQRLLEELGDEVGVPYAGGAANADAASGA